MDTTPAPAPTAPTLAQALVALLEKAVSTYVQAVIVALLSSSFFEQVDLSLLQSLAIASIPTGLTVLLAALDSAVAPDSWPYALRAVYRVLRTAAAAFLGYLIAAPIFELSTSMLDAALAAAGMALLAAIKAELARAVGDPNSPALIPSRFALAA